MSAATLTRRISTAEVEHLAPKAWRSGLLERRSRGARMVSLFGRADGPEVVITAVLEEPAGALHVSRTRTTVEHGYHELTSEWPGLHCFERELHEQTGVRVAGHPWLKPIRYEGRDQSAMDTYPFYRIEGKEVHEVAVGPIHAGVIEPGSFRFMCHGEQVHHLEIHLGYQHRGVEKQLLRGDARRLAPLVETIAGDSSVAHAWAYSAAIEALAGLEVPPAIEAARAVALELERVAMHLAGLTGLSADVGFLQGATTYGRLRTTAINTSMQLCGSRFGRGAVRPGGVGMRLPRELLEVVRENLQLLRVDLAIINERFLEAQTVAHRLQRVGVVDTRQAEELGLVGMAARASGMLLDLRRDAAGGPYHEVPLTPVVLPDGDCWARAVIRIRELDVSLAWVARILEVHPDWDPPGEPARPRRPELGELAPGVLVVSAVEGWRGEVVHALETDERGRLLHYKVQDPSLRNWMGLAIAVRENEISDFPICNKSFDLSYCGNDL